MEFVEESTDGPNFKAESYCTLTELKEDGGDVLFVLRDSISQHKHRRDHVGLHLAGAALDG